MTTFKDGFATESGDVLVYIFDRFSGEFLGKGLVHVSEGCGLAPGQTLDVPPRAKQGHVVVRESDSWHELEDHRGTVYSTEDGEAVEHVLLGALPKGLTKQSRPSIHHRWKGSTWMLDQIAAEKHKRDQDSNRARAYLASTDWYVVRQQETGKPIPGEIVASRNAAREAVMPEESRDV